MKYEFIRHHGAMSLALAILMTACAKDETMPLPVLEEHTYSSSSLTISYCGETMPGKTATFIPDTDDHFSGLLRLYSTLDLSQLGQGFEGVLPAPGVIPGSPSVDLPVSLVAGHDSYDFSGRSSTESCDFSYDGTITDQKLHLSLTDVRLHDRSLAGMVLVPASLKDGAADGSVKSPIYVDWQIEPSSDVDIDLSAFLQALLDVPVIPVQGGIAHMSVPQLISRSLQTVAFLDNGNVVIRYYAYANGNMQFFTSCGNTVQYVTDAEKILLYLNPFSAYATWLALQSSDHIVTDPDFRQSPSGVSSDIMRADADRQALKEALMPVLSDIAGKMAPMLATGLPLETNKTATNVNIYLDTATCLRIMSAIAQGIFDSPEATAALYRILSAHPEFAGMTEEIGKLLTNLPSFLEKSTTLHIGMSFEQFRGS